MPLRSRLSSFAKEASAALHLAKLVGPGPEAALTTLLFHRFFLPDEPPDSGRERLRRRLQWLRKHYTPLTPAQALDGLANAALPRFPALVTIDDVDAGFLKVEDIFREFEVPVALFACVGWTDLAGSPEPQTLLARVVALLEWGDRSDREITFHPRFTPIRLAEPYKADRTEGIDRIIGARDDIDLGDLASQLEPMVKSRTCCNWGELKDLANKGHVIGCHSVSHIHLAQASQTRMAFEIEEARRIILAKFGRCEHFAYPFGKRASVSAATTSEIKRCGFETAFLTHADFATGQTDRYHLPRLVIPDEQLSQNGFQAIVRGGAIPLDKAKRLIAGRSKDQ